MMRQWTAASHIPIGDEADGDAGEAGVNGMMIPVTVLVFFGSGKWDVSTAWEALRLPLLFIMDDMIML
jgi:hypothetical protein